MCTRSHASPQAHPPTHPPTSALINRWRPCLPVPPQLCKSLLKQASQLYLRGGIGDAASTALEKSGKELEKQGQYEEAADVFLAVADIYETDDKIRRMRVPLERAVGGFIKAKKLESAMETLKKQAVLFNQVQEQNNIDKVNVSP